MSGFIDLFPWVVSLWLQFTVQTAQSGNFMTKEANWDAPICGQWLWCGWWVDWNRFLGALWRCGFIDSWQIVVSLTGLTLNCTYRLLRQISNITQTLTWLGPCHYDWFLASGKHFDPDVRNSGGMKAIFQEFSSILYSFYVFYWQLTVLSHWQFLF